MGIKNSHIIYSTFQTTQTKNAVHHELANGLLMLQSRVHILEHLCPELLEKEQWNLLASDIGFMDELLQNISNGHEPHARLSIFDLFDLTEDACEGFEAVLRTNQVPLLIFSKNDGLPSVTDFYGDYFALKNCIVRLLSAALELSLHCRNASTDCFPVIPSSSKIIPIFENRAIYVQVEGFEDSAVITISTHSGGSDHHHDFENIDAFQSECDVIGDHGGWLNITKKGNMTFYSVKLPISSCFPCP